MWGRVRWHNLHWPCPGSGLPHTLSTTVIGPTEDVLPTVLPMLPHPEHPERVLCPGMSLTTLTSPCLFLRTPHEAGTVSPSLYGGTSCSLLTGVPRGTTLFPFHKRGN